MKGVIRLTRMWTHRQGTLPEIVSSNSRVLDCGGRKIDLGSPAIMGVINVTPDSFSDGGKYFSTASAVEHGVRLVEEGADILDIGGESTRPGSKNPGVEEELDRVLPVVQDLANRVGVPLSVDTSTPEVMRECVSSGAGLINDVRALQNPGALEAAADCDVPVCLMHMRGEPETMQIAPDYNDVTAQVHGFLVSRVARARAAGIKADKIIVDPGFGFGKTLEHNLTLLRRLREFADIGFALLAGLSRKSMITQILGYPTDDRVASSISLALFAMNKGASILRVHDVRATREAISVWRAVVT